MSPNTVLIAGIAFLFGLGIPFLIIYLIQILDTTIRGRKDIEDNLSVPFLGDIPQYSGENNGAASSYAKTAAIRCRKLSA